MSYVDDYYEGISISKSYLVSDITNMFIRDSGINSLLVTSNTEQYKMPL